MSELVEFTGELVAIASENPPGNEGEVATYLTERLAASSVPFDIEVHEVAPGRPNVIARVGDPRNGSVLLCGHTDVVPAAATDWSGDPYDLRECNGRLIGRGVADMKGALAAKLLAAERYYHETDDPGEVILAFVVDEEHDGAGARALVDRGIDADAAVIGEPTELEVCIAQKGVLRSHIVVHGRGAHSGRPDEGLNAIVGAARVVERLETLDATLREETTHPLLAPETLTVTEISGGTAPNVVPDRVRLTVDWRLHPERTDPGVLDERLVETVSGPLIDDQPLSIDLERTVFARGAAVDPESDLIEETVRAASAVGRSASVIGFNAATDARFLVHDAGIPTILFGPGSIERDAHTVDESISKADLVATMETYTELLTRLL